jgi:hypothetical protein
MYYSMIQNQGKNLCMRRRFTGRYKREFKSQLYTLCIDITYLLERVQ